MSAEAPSEMIDRILMPPPMKRSRDRMESRITENHVVFSTMPSSSNLPPMHPNVHTQENPSSLEASGASMLPRTDGLSVPESVAFVTPPKGTPVLLPTHATDRAHDANNFSETDSTPTERSTVIEGDMWESTGQDQNEHEDSQPETTSTQFSDIIGHASVKLRVDEMLLPLALPPALANSILTGVRSLPAALLLYGPPGCGKTQLARAIAGEARAAFISVGPSDVLSKFVGESEASVRSIFRRAYDEAKRMESLCSVLFFDEIDALGHSRGSADVGAQGSGNDGCSRRVLAELLIQLTLLGAPANDDDKDICALDSSSIQAAGFPGRINEDKFPSICSPEELAPAAPFAMIGNLPPDENACRRDGPKARIIVVAATNRPEDCDPALLRRFSIRVNVGLPTNRDRRKILSKFLSEFEHSITKAQLMDLAVATEGWSGSDLESLAREAAMAPIRECLRSAAMLKRRTRKLEQQGGDESGQGLKPRPVDADEQARTTLLRDFRVLRPVMLEDFEDAFEFWLGNQQTATTGGTVQQKRKQVHYDSTSSSDSDNEG